MFARTASLTIAAMILLSGVLAVPAAYAAEKQRVVYHVADPEKVGFALNNMRNHIKGVGGKDNVELVLVVHGPALKQFHKMETTDRIRTLVEGLQAEGVEFDACGNTMRAMSFASTDVLVPGFVRVDQGGVVRIAELQQQGFLYIRP